MNSTLPILTPDIIEDVRVDQKIHKKIYEVVKLFHQKAKQYRLTYWAVGGTQLGIVRHSGLIPWDDDTDFGVFDFDEDLLKQVLANICEHHKNYYYFEILEGLERTRGWKLRHVFELGEFDLDFFISECVWDKGEKDWIVRTKPCDDRNDVIPWPNDIILMKDLFDDQEQVPEFKFGNTVVCGAAYPKKYLDFKYPEWDTVVHIFNHKNFTEPMKIKYQLSQEILNYFNIMSG